MAPGFIFIVVLILQSLVLAEAKHQDSSITSLLVGEGLAYRFTAQRVCSNGRLTFLPKLAGSSVGEKWKGKTSGFRLSLSETEVGEPVIWAQVTALPACWCDSCETILCIWPCCGLLVDWKEGRGPLRGEKIKKPEHRREIEQSETPKRYFSTSFCVCAAKRLLSAQKTVEPYVLHHSSVHLPHRHPLLTPPISAWATMPM